MKRVRLKLDGVWYETLKEFCEKLNLNYFNTAQKRIRAEKKGKKYFEITKKMKVFYE